MIVFLNGESREVQSNTLDGAMAELGFGDTVVATAVNGDFVASANRASTQLNEGDRLEVLAPMQGG